MLTSRAATNSLNAAADALEEPPGHDARHVVGERGDEGAQGEQHQRHDQHRHAAAQVGDAPDQRQHGDVAEQEPADDRCRALELVAQGRDLRRRRLRRFIIGGHREMVGGYHALDVLGQEARHGGDPGCLPEHPPAELPHHAEHVHLHPALHDLALDHPIYGMAYKLDPLAGRVYPLELAQVRAQKHETVGHLLPFGNLLHVGTSVVWEGTTHLGHVTLKLIGKLGSHELIQRLQVAFANRLRDPVGQDLVLLCRH